MMTKSVLFVGVSLVFAVAACSSTAEDDAAQQQDAIATFDRMQKEAQDKAVADGLAPVEAVAVEAIADEVPNCKTSHLGLSIRAYIAPVNCDNFVRDMGTKWPIGAGNGKELDWRAFCVATNAMFSETVNGTFRMAQTSDITVECCDGVMKSATSKTECRMGEELGPGGVKLGQGVNTGCFNSVGLGTFETTLSGHPPLQLEPGMQAMGPRACSDIWASTKGTFACGADNVARFTSATTSSSNFPTSTFRYFDDSGKVAERTAPQGSMAALWECTGDKVSGGGKGVAIQPPAAPVPVPAPKK